MRIAASLGLAATLAFAASAGVRADSGLPEGDWRTINRDLAATRYSPLDQINRSNVTGLVQAWSTPLRAFGNAVPLVIDGVMYVSAGTRVLALDADTGAEVWVHEEPRPEGQQFGGGVSSRGVGYWAGGGSDKPRILVMAGNDLLALDAATGKPVASFGTNGKSDVGVGYGGTPTIVGDVAVIGAASLESPQGDPGNPRGFDVRTGKKVWEFQTVPKKGEPYNDTWGDGWENRGGANMWGFAATADEASNTVYLPIGGPAHNYYGGDRPGSNVYANSIVAVDSKTGAYKWHFQTVHHDLWDSDQPTAGPLVPLTVDGKKQTAIATVGKTSYFYVLDSKTGVPVHAVEETPVPHGDVPTEYYHPTQPIPVKTPALSRMAMSFNDIVTAEDTTAEHAAACKAMWYKAGGYINLGPFTPFMYKPDGAPPRSTIQFPGGIGGVNWGGPAADPTTGMVYVNSLDGSLVGWVEKVPEGARPYSFDASVAPAYDRASVDGKGPFFSFSAPVDGKYDENGRGVGVNLPCFKPPWARLTAIDANTGEVKWAVPLGIYENMPEGKQLLGNAGSAGPTVTGGGLVFIGATNDKRLRAFDSASGKQLWEAVLGNNANANPMSYRGKSGKQYVAINAGGSIVAFALPN
jgi:glucose dehydrogenase